MQQDRLERQMAFCREIDKEKFIARQTYLSDGVRRENDAEHAWHMAVMAILLYEYANEPVDLLKVVTMILMHDIVEIDAGDTYAYDEEGKKTQQQREHAAAERLYGMLPGDQKQKFMALFEEFEKAETPEAKFARAMDNIQPLLLNAATDGKSWQERGIRLSQVLGRNEITPKGSSVLWDYAYGHMICPNVDAGRLKDDRKGE